MARRRGLGSPDRALKKLQTIEDLLKEPPRKLSEGVKKSEESNRNDEIKHIQKSLCCDLLIATRIYEQRWVEQPLLETMAHSVRIISLAFHQAQNELLAQITLAPTHCSKKEAKARAEIHLGNQGSFSSRITQPVPTYQRAAELFKPSLQSLSIWARKTKVASPE